MCTKTKIWKPGQLVTIDHKVYRVVKSPFGCIDCANVNTMSYSTPCIICTAHRGVGTVLEELKPNKNK